MLDLKELAHEHGYRVGLDESARLDPARSERHWYYRIPCRRGRGFIGVHGPALLSAYAAGPTACRLMALDGVQVIQRGDNEARVVFPPERLPEVARVLQPFRRRRLSPEARQAAAERITRHRFQATASI